MIDPPQLRAAHAALGLRGEHLLEESVSEQLWTTRKRIAVVPQGGNTSYCGGATPGAAGNEILLSLRRMRRTFRWMWGRPSPAFRTILLMH